MSKFSSIRSGVAVLWHGRPLAEAECEGRVAIEGSRRAAKRLLGLLPAPAPVG